MAKQTKRKTGSIGYAAFKVSLAEKTPPPDVAPAVEALWYAANGFWERAHQAAQKRDDADSAWVHAYLHRMEGDDDNARYWYGRAGRPVSAATHADEWDEIAKALLD